MIELADIESAAVRLDGVANRTPVLRSRTLGAGVALKAELFQRGGAFKFRGAYNTAAQMTREELERGICAVSSGNHAQAVALAAAELGSRAVILMPHDAPEGKLAATAGYGAEIVRYDRYADDREDLLTELSEERGLSPIHPYDDERVMAGAGTAALELFAEVGDLDVLYVPCGGGGLLAGTSTAAAALCPGCRVIGVEPETGDDTQRSFAAGERVRIPVPRTIADGLQLAMPGEKTFAVNRERVAAIETVSDDELRAAMRFAFERLKIALEPSGAAGLAALLRQTGDGPVTATDQRVGIILTGGNVSAERFRELLA